MTSGPGTTGKTNVPPDEAIEEISGLLEMDDLKGGDAKAADVSDHPGTDAAHFGGNGEGLDVSMETPAPVSLESYLVPPPVSDEHASQKTPEPQSASSTNMAYEDLLEKLVLPATPAEPAEPQEAEEPPPFASTRTSSSHPVSSSIGSLFPQGETPGPAQTEERTVVTANPLLAEEQQAAAREAESYILPPAAAPTPAFTESPIVAQPARPGIQTTGLAPGKVVQLSYPVLGGILLGAALVGGLFTHLMSPSRTAVPPTSTPTAVATPVIPAQPAPPANPAPHVQPVPTPPAPAAAQPAAAAEAKPVREVAPAEPAVAPEESEGEAKEATKPKAHHAAAKAARPPKPVAAKPAPAPKPVAAKPASAPKPAPAKKPGKGWVDPFL